jgi:hypothetical protein
MASRITLDPVQGLVDYVLEIKPYHTKIVEVLVEYIQIEPIDVTITENIQMCVNLGIPDLDTKYSYTIIGVDTIANIFTIAGDQLLSLHVGQVMEVFRSLINNNRYTITSLVFDGTNTMVGVSANIPSATVDGVIVYRTIAYCPNSNLYGEYISSPIDESCSGGFGQVFDSIPPAYNVTSFNTTTNQIVADGNLSSIFSIGIQFHLEHVTDAAPDTLVDAVYTVNAVTVDNSNPLNPVTTITTTQSIPSLAFGSPAVIPSVTNASIYPLDTQYNITDINDGGVNIFSLLGDFTSIFPIGTLIDVRYSDGNDGIYYVLRSDFTGGDTKINVAQHIPFPSATNLGTLRVKHIGFDEVVYCTDVPEARIDVRFDERIEFNTQIDLQDTIVAYNLENTDTVPFGGLPYGTIIDTVAPTITSSETAPVSPSLFDLWFDVYDITNSANKIPSGLKQWNGLRWVGISVAYWFDSTNEKLYDRRFGKLGGSPSAVTDTGWLEITTFGGYSDLTSPVLTTGFSNEPHIVFHGPENVNTTDRYEIYGGNFAYHFFGGTIFDGFDDTQKLGDWQITTFPVVAVGSGGSPVYDMMSIPGDQTTYFTAGLSFYVDYTLTNKGWFTVVNSTFDGTNTNISVNETVVNATFTNSSGSPISTIDQNYSKNLGIIQGALFDVSTQSTIVVPTTAVHADVDRITYKWIGPLQLGIDMLPEDLFNSTVPDVLGLSNEIVSGANYLNIIDVDLTFDYFTVIGDQTAFFPDSGKFTIQSAYTDGLSPETTNNGSWTVSRSFYNGAGSETILAVDTAADTFTIAGNYADKFIPGFTFTVYQSGSPTNEGNYTVLLSGSPNIGATYDAGSDTTTIPVTTQVPITIVDGGSPYPIINGYITFDGTDETNIYIVGNVIIDQQPYGKIIDIQSSVGTQLSGSITDDLNFGWTVSDWFQYTILSVGLVENTITVAGDARGDLQIGQDFEIIGAFDSTGSPTSGSPSGVTNNGLYNVRIDEDYRWVGSPPVMSRAEVEYDGSSSTTIAIYPTLSTLSHPYGFIEPNNDAQAIITFTDTIGIVTTEDVDGAVLQTGGSIVNSWDYPYWDVGSFDETLGTVIHLYSNTFA